MYHSSMAVPDQVLDCRDDLCPGPLLKVTKTLKTLAIGHLLEVRAAEPGAARDIEALAQRTGQEVLEIHAEAEEVRILIRRLR